MKAIQRSSTRRGISITEHPLLKSSGTHQQCHPALDRCDEARPLLELNVPIVVENRGPQHRRSEEAIRRILFLYDRCGEPHQAAPWRSKLPPLPLAPGTRQGGQGCGQK